MVKIGVVGAGAVGLSSAINVQKLLPGAEVTIIADRFGNETTSAGAGGLFRPTVFHANGIPIETLKRWSKASWNHFSQLASSPEAASSGNNITNGFVLQDKLEVDQIINVDPTTTKPSLLAREAEARLDPIKASSMEENDGLFASQPQFLNEVVFSYHQLSQEELRRINSTAKYGYNVTTVVTEPKRYLGWLMKKFKEKGGKVVVKTLESLEELCGQCDVVVNCCGLRADQLVGDTRMRPSRGQLVKVRAPWVRGFYVVEEGSTTTYTIPHRDYLIVGGCRQDGNTSEEIDPAMTQNILDRANRLIPGFKGAEVIGHWVGIRPVREPIRVEKETMNFSGKQLKVVHNYGHGGNGITLSWSTSLDAAQMVKDILDTRTPVSRL